MCGEGNAQRGGKNGTAFQNQASSFVCGGGGACNTEGGCKNGIPFPNQASPFVFVGKVMLGEG